MANNIVSGLIITDETANAYEGDLYLNVTVNNRGYLYVSGGEVDVATINDGGFFYVSSAGVANSTTVNNGRMYVYGGGANDTTLNAGQLRVFSGGEVNDTTVNTGSMYVSNGATANNVAVTSTGGFLFILDGGTVNDASASSGQIRISSGGVASNITVDSAGQLRVYGGGKMTGRMQIEEGATITTSAGAIIDFDISTVAPDAEARLNDLSRITRLASVDFTVTVSDTQTTGSYVLAEGASSFNNTITVQNTSGEALGSVTVGNRISIDGKSYELSLSDGALSLTVSSPIISGLIVDDTVSVLNGETYNSTTVVEGGNFHVSSGGVANDTTVNNGRMYVSGGGIANNAALNAGQIRVFSGGEVNDATVILR